MLFLFGTNVEIIVQFQILGYYRRNTSKLWRIKIIAIKRVVMLYKLFVFQNPYFFEITEICHFLFLNKFYNFVLSESNDPNAISWDRDKFRPFLENFNASLESTTEEMTNFYFQLQCDSKGQGTLLQNCCMFGGATTLLIDCSTGRTSFSVKAAF